jgi:hypothetical protein
MALLHCQAFFASNVPERWNVPRSGIHLQQNPTRSRRSVPESGYPGADLPLFPEARDPDPAVFEEVNERPSRQGLPFAFLEAAGRQAPFCCR